MLERRFIHAVEIASAAARGQDRAQVLTKSEGLVVVLADGAGGTGNGEIAAQAVVDAALASRIHDWSALIAELDQDVARLGNGQTTAVLLAIGADGVDGASVGDSGAWLVGSDIVDLTEGQIRKPLIGAGCIPYSFHAEPLGGTTLVVASDGLFRYAKRQDIARLASGPDLAAAARALIDLVRLPTGGLQDDVAIVLCREVG